MGDLFRTLFRAVARVLKKLFGSSAAEEPVQYYPQPEAIPPPDPKLAMTPAVVVRVEATFAETELRDLAAQLRLEEVGQENGRKNQPPSDNTAPDPVERQLVALIQHRMSRIRAEYEKAAYSLETAGLKAEVDACRSRIHDMTEEALIGLRAQARASRDEVFLRLQAARMCRQEMETFRKQNGLERNAQPIRSHAARVFVLGVLVIIEGVFNGSLFQRGLWGGLRRASR